MTTAQPSSLLVPPSCGSPSLWPLRESVLDPHRQYIPCLHLNDLLSKVSRNVLSCSTATPDLQRFRMKSRRLGSSAGGLTLQASPLRL
eukprot:65678-Amphidinium_carterae.1